jgi:hypothetical protein
VAASVVAAAKPLRVCAPQLRRPPRDVPQPLDPPDVAQLAVAEVVEHGVAEQAQHLPLARVAAERELLERQRADRQEHAEQHGHEQERDEERPVEQPERPRDRQQDVGDELDDRPDELEDQEVRQREQAEHALARPAERGAVTPQPLGQPPLPAAALARERAEVLGRLGPAHRVGQERDPERLAALAQVAVQAHDELGVLADRVRPPAADGLDRVAAEQAERAGDDEQAVELAPADPADEERPEVLDDLEHGEPARGQADVDDGAVPDPAAVGDAHDATGRDDALGVVDDRLGHPHQRVLLDHRVGVDRAQVRVAGGVGARVERVGLAAVGLVDDEQVRVPARGVRRADLGRGDRGAQDLLGRDEVERLDEPRQGPVGRAVGHDDDLELGVAQAQEGADRLDDPGLLVERGQQHGHARRQRGRERLVGAGERAAAQVLGDRAPGDAGEGEVDRVQDGEVRDGEDAERLDGGPHAAARRSAVACAARRCGPADGRRAASASAAGAMRASAAAAAAAGTWSSRWATTASRCSEVSSPTAPSAVAAAARTAGRRSSRRSCSDATSSSAPRRPRAAHAAARTAAAGSRRRPASAGPSPASPR